MSWIAPLDFNMNFSLSLIERKSNHFLIALAQKIAVYSVIPLALIIFFEAVVKNMIVYNLANVVVVVLNAVHSATMPRRQTP